MAKSSTRFSEVVLPEYIPENLGTPFKVILRDSVRQIVDEETGEVQKTVIPNPRGLLQSIAVTRLIWPRKLAGADIKFIRKSLKLRATDLAGMIEVSPEHLSRCEAGERVLSPGVEKCLRIAILLDLLKLPEDSDVPGKKNEAERELFAKYAEIVARLKVIMKGMNIPAAHDASDELCLTFYVSKSDSDEPSRNEEEHWNGEEAALAA
jgi:transcriptional regulator with XRE-family HTH domain